MIKLIAQILVYKIIIFNFDTNSIDCEIDVTSVGLNNSISISELKFFRNVDSTLFIVQVAPSFRESRKFVKVFSFTNFYIVKEFFEIKREKEILRRKKLESSAAKRRTVEPSVLTFRDFAQVFDN